MWTHLRERFRQIQIRVLHPRIPIDKFVHIRRGLPEGSRLSPVLFGIVAADLVRELMRRFPDSRIILNGVPQGNALSAGGPAPSSSIWVGGLFYADDLALSSTNPEELQSMIDTVQNWSEKARL